uniref:Phosphopantothenoylcysteine decarboxylase/phosphopantothenate-cysteine ligase n=1 Tax=Vitiosangium cumulatum TaxID=1867796 RepID=A0A7D4XV55_9BACT|nr:phosphopantothenoylcysteine decarboxylase/phosphopantothenate-cysteine ligase [Vitiosangium cumulatum]
MSAYVLVEITVKDAETYERYKQLAPPSIGLYGGRYLVRGGATETLEGTWAPTRFVILEFPSVERARAWWSSPEYAPAKALRQASTNTDMLLVEGLPPGADPAARK